VDRLLDGVGYLTADDGSHPRLYRVEGYHHADLAHVQIMGYRHATMVERNVSVVAEVEERIV
jgi:hypothetical protein